MSVLLRINLTNHESNLHVSHRNQPKSVAARLGYRAKTIKSIEVIAEGHFDDMVEIKRKMLDDK